MHRLRFRIECCWKIPLTPFTRGNSATSSFSKGGIWRSLAFQKGEFSDREVYGKEILNGEEGWYRDCRVWDDIS